MMYIKVLKEFFGESTFVNTKKHSEFNNKIYGEKVVIKNSIKLNFQLLLFFIIIDIILLSNIKGYSNKLYTIIFCVLILIFPILKIINRNPKLIISKEGVISNGKSIEWAEIVSTLIEENDTSEVASYFKLHLVLKNDKRLKVSLSDQNYSVDEISHIIEYYKERD